MANILVIDDDEIIRNLLVNILCRVGHTLMEAGNGLMALEQLKSCQVDLVITDILMPEMDGIDLLMMILNSHPNSKVIAISGGHKALRSEKLLQMAQTLGAVAIIAKPFQVKTILEAVDLALKTDCRKTINCSNDENNIEKVNCFQKSNILDFEKLAAMRQELGDNFFSVIKLFQSGLLERPEKISQSIKENNPRQVAMESHSLKSICRQIGLYSIGTMAANLEVLADSGELHGADSLVRQIIEAGELAHLELTNYSLAANPPPAFFEQSVKSFSVW